MRIIAIVLSGMLAVCLSEPVFAAKAASAPGYQTGCNGSSCLYRSGSQKSQKAKQAKHHKSN